MDLHRIETFLDDYKELEHNSWEELFNSNIDAFNAFLKRFSTFDEQIQEIKKLEAPFYNIFEILNIRYYEVKVHTPFLRHLLDPKASHEQVALFLDSFLQEVLHLPYIYADFSHFEIHEEFSIDDGRIDLIIMFVADGQRKVVLIENKIYAKDLCGQLTKYHNHLINKLKLDENDFRLVYLTPNGKMPSKISMTPELRTVLHKSGNLLEIGYRQDIIPWLTACNQKIKATRVQHTLFQYIKTLESL